MSGNARGHELGMPLSGTFFEDMLDPFGWPLLSAGSFRPLAAKPQTRGMPIDIKEAGCQWYTQLLNAIVSNVQKDKEFHISADIPGVKKEDIQLDHEGDTLSISVDHKDAKEEKKEEEGTKWHRVERSSFFVKRSLRLPETADFENISAAYNDGVLSVTVPKLALEQQKRKRINIA